MSKGLEPIWVQIVWIPEEKGIDEVSDLTRVVTERIRDNYEDYGIGLILVDGFSNVVHLIFHLKATQSLNQIVSHIKSETEHFIKDEKGLSPDFKWYDGHRSFSIEPDAVEKIRNFIETQKKNPHIVRLNPVTA